MLAANVVASARADAPAPPADAARAARAMSVGEGASALPGLARLRVPRAHDVGFALRASAGYGFTESVQGAPGPHHRVPSALAIAAHATPWLAFALTLDGHGDFHPNDRGFVGRGALEVRAAPALGEHVSLGIAASARTAGGASPSLVARATSFESSLALAVSMPRAHDGALVFAGEVGFRLDRSSRAVPRGALYRPGDRLAIGYSDFDAVLLRAGVSYRVARWEAFGELAADVLVGAGHPSFAESPLHAALGGRVRPRADLGVELVVDVAASRRPAVGNGLAFIPIDPRLTLGASLVYRYSAHLRAAPATERAHARDEEREAARGADSGTEARDTGDGRVVSGLVRDSAGEPLVDAHVHVVVGDARVDGFTDAEGRFRLERVPVGAGTLHVEAVGHAPIVRPLGRREAVIPDDELQLAVGAPTGVLRGLVRDFEARAVRAEVTVRPGALRRTTMPDGTFSFELPAGRHRVAITAPGFVTQERDVDLRAGEVTILHVDLREAR